MLLFHIWEYKGCHFKDPLISFWSISVCVCAHAVSLSLCSVYALHFGILFLYLPNPLFLLCLFPAKTESLSSPMHRLRTVPSSSVMTPSVGCVVTPGLRWCRSPVPVASCMDLTPRDQRWPTWLKLCWEQRRGRWRFPSTLKMVWFCQLWCSCVPPPNVPSF